MLWAVLVAALPGRRTVARDVKRRIRGVLFSDEIPHPRDVVIICLADACGLFRELLSKRELDQASPRIAQIRQWT